MIDILRSMGADIEERPVGGADDGVGEPIADLVVRSSELRAVELGPADVAAAIDEIPVLCLAAAAATGTTVIRGAGELRHKESDRIAGTVSGLRALGARIEVDGDDLVPADHPGGRALGPGVDLTLPARADDDRTADGESVDHQLLEPGLLPDDADLVR